MQPPKTTVHVITHNPWQMYEIIQMYQRARFFGANSTHPSFDWASFGSRNDDQDSGHMGEILGGTSSLLNKHSSHGIDLIPKSLLLGLFRNRSFWEHFGIQLISGPELALFRLIMQLTSVSMKLCSRLVSRMFRCLRGKFVACNTPIPMEPCWDDRPPWG